MVKQRLAVCCAVVLAAAPALHLATHCEWSRCGTATDLTSVLFGQRASQNGVKNQPIKNTIIGEWTHNAQVGQRSPVTSFIRRDREQARSSPVGGGGGPPVADTSSAQPTAVSRIVNVAARTTRPSEGPPASDVQVTQVPTTTAIISRAAPAIEDIALPVTLSGDVDVSSLHRVLPTDVALPAVIWYHTR
jgi:hypothetical protein